MGEMFPWMGWKDHPVQRSFDALRFMRLPDQGVVWSGMFATYPPLVPPAHVRAARLCMRRQLLFQGSVAELPDDATPGARDFTAHQSQQGARFHSYATGKMSPLCSPLIALFFGGFSG